MAVITLARQVGSGGTTIAQLVAAELGYRVVGRKELVEEASALGLWLPSSFANFADEHRLTSGRPAHASPLYFSIGELEFDDALRGSAPSATLEARPTSFLEEMASARRTLLLTVASLTYGLAADDRLLLVGAGSQYLLAGILSVLRVKTIAPAEIRAERLAQAYSLDASTAQRAVLDGDRSQLEYNRAIFDADWDDPLHWDLIINSEIFTPEIAAEMIISSAKRREEIDPDLARMRSSLRLASEINRALIEHDIPHSWLVATPATDGVIIHGDIPDSAQARIVLDTADNLSGSMKVIDALTVQGVRPTD